MLTPLHCNSVCSTVGSQARPHKKGHMDAHRLSSIFPQQRKLMGSSVQNRSGVHWCRSQVRFNEVPEKVPKVPEKVWEALVQSQVGFNRVPEKVPEKVWEALVLSQVRFNSLPEKVPKKVWAKAGPIQLGSGEGSGAGLGDFGATPGQFQQGSEEGRRLREALVQSQVKFTRVPRRRFRRRSGRLRCRVNRLPEKVWKAWKALQGQVQKGSGEGSGEGLGGFGAEAGQVQQDLRLFNSRKHRKPS